jgi:membrane associated rhomboid family serine protease
MIPLHDDNPTERPPIVTVALIVVCVLVFLWQVSLDAETQQAVVYSLGVIPATLIGDRYLSDELYLVAPPVTIVTSMFLHGGWMHLIGNMLYLWIFGNNVEDAMGHGRFVAFYVLCGTAAALAQSVPDPDAIIPMVGASGAISGVLGAYLLLFPHARVLVVIPIGIILQTVRMPALFVLGFWFVLQIVSSLLAGDQEGGGVAFAAHLGGFVAGLALIPLFKRRGVPLLQRWPTGRP